jgi:hypothetical protein
MSRPFFWCSRIRSRQLCGLFLLAATVGSACAEERKIIGWIEHISVNSNALLLEAKVDTGADYSSVHAEDIRQFTRDGMQWVEFTLRDPSGKRHVLQKPLERIARVKKKTTGFQARPVVMLELCVGDVKRMAQVNLAERGHFKYPLLLGRSFLSKGYLVDSSAKHLLPPACH